MYPLLKPLLVSQAMPPPGVSIAGGITPSTATASAAAAAAAAAASAAKQQSGKSQGTSAKPWENDSLSSSSSSSSSSSGSSYTSSSEEEADEEAVAATKQQSLRTAQPPNPPLPSSKPRLTEEQLRDPFRTRPQFDQQSIASSTISRPENLPLPEKVERFEEKMRGGKEKAIGPLLQARNPFNPVARSKEPGPAVPARNAHYENTAQVAQGEFSVLFFFSFSFHL